MSSVVELLQRSKFKSGSEMGRMIVGKLQTKNMQGRIFNDFPTMFTPEQLDPLVNGYVAILARAQVDDDLNIDKQTMQNLNKWFNNVVGLACAQFLDIEGQPKNSLVRYFKLKDDELVLLKQHLSGLLCSAAFNVIDYVFKQSLTQLSQMENKSTLHTAVSGYMNKHFNASDYYQARYQDIYGKNKCEKMHTKLIGLRKDLEGNNESMRKKLREMGDDVGEVKRTNLIAKKEAVEKGIGLLDDYRDGAINVMELKEKLEAVLEKLGKRKRIGIFRETATQTSSTVKGLNTMHERVAELAALFEIKLPTELQDQQPAAVPKL